jgi:hypothetical protein
MHKHEWESSDARSALRFMKGKKMSSTATSGAKTNVLAIVSLVTSIIGFGLVGVITGHIGLNQIKKTGEEGRGLAIAGLVIGYITIAAALLILLIWGLALGGLAVFLGTQATYVS